MEKNKKKKIKKKKKKKKKKKWRPEFGLIWTKSGLKLGFLLFSQVWFIIFP